jgi:hypothetical protein
MDAKMFTKLGYNSGERQKDIFLRVFESIEAH